MCGLPTLLCDCITSANSANVLIKENYVFFQFERVRTCDDSIVKSFEYIVLVNTVK